MATCGVVIIGKHARKIVVFSGRRYVFLPHLLFLLPLFWAGQFVFLH